MGEEVFVHEAMIAFWVVAGDTDVLVLEGSVSLNMTLL
jgi:hypothetical protein